MLGNQPNAPAARITPGNGTAKKPQGDECSNGPAHQNGGRELARSKPTPPDDGLAPLIADDQLHEWPPTARRWVAILVVGLVLWFTPTVVAALLFGRTSIFVDQGLCFSAGPNDWSRMDVRGAIRSSRRR